MVNLHFVKPGYLSKAAASALGQLETNRELSDYRAAAAFSAEDACQAIADAQAFIAECPPLIPFLDGAP